eukprot:4532064-Ditylum_brightwellii.AAC.1
MRERELSAEPCVVAEIEGMCIGGGSVSVGNEQKGYVMFMRGENGAEIDLIHHLASSNKGRRRHPNGACCHLFKEKKKEASTYCGAYHLFIHNNQHEEGGIHILWSLPSLCKRLNPPIAQWC